MARQRNAHVELTLGADRFDQGLARRGRDLRKFARDGERSLGSLGRRAGGGAGGALKSIGNIAGGVLGGGLAMAGIGGAASIVEDVMDFERGLTRFGIATDMSDAKLAAFRGSLHEVSRASGLNREELMNGAAAYVALTGDAEGAAGGVALFAKVANATGASMADIAATAAAMKTNLRIDPKDFEAGFSALAVQGKAGAIELRDLATLLAGVAPQFAQFKGGEGAQGLAEMGAALQVIKQGFGSSAEAATGLRALMVSMNRNAGKFQQAGIKIYDRDPKTGAKRLRAFSEIVDAIANSKLAKDPSLLTKAFGSDEAKRAYDQLVLNAGMMDDLMAKASDKNAIDRDAARYQESAAGRLDKAWNGIKLQIAEAFTPERIAAFITALEHIVEMINQISNFLGRGAEVVSTAGSFVGDALHGASVASREHDARQWELMMGYGGTARTPEQAAAFIANQDYAVWGSVMAPVPANELEAAKQAARAASLWGPMFEPSAQNVYGQLGQANARRAAAMFVVNVQVDGNTIAKATANAPANNTRAGGI
jgi:TP901 family phage tail tape measure protein